MSLVKQRPFAVILAAGQSSRFGSTKQLAKLDDRTLIERATATASRVFGERVVVIAGADWSDVTRSATTICKFFALNESFAEGIGTSIAFGARLCENRTDAMLLMLADQPLVTDTHLRALLDTWTGDDHQIVASAYANTVGPPVLFPHGAFKQLTELKADVGARCVLEDPRFDSISVAFEDGAIDIDTVEELGAIS